MSVPVTRRTVRDTIAAGLAATMTTAQAVYGYQALDFSGQSPVVRVFSAATMRPQFPEQGMESVFMLNVQLWVLFTSRDGEWQAADAENLLDAMELELITWITDNQTMPALWNTLTYDRPSAIDNIVVGGDVWLVEDVLLRAEVYG